jgi:hypothetical protein
MYATGTDDARRYAPGFSPIVGFADVLHPNFDGLAPYCGHDEHFYCDGWTGRAPAGWRIDAESTMFKMVWESSNLAADDAPGRPTRCRTCIAGSRTGRSHASGPFGPGTIELGDLRHLRDRPVGHGGER